MTQHQHENTLQLENMQRATGYCVTRVMSSLLTQQADSGGSLARQKLAVCAASKKVVLKAQ